MNGNVIVYDEFGSNEDSSKAKAKAKVKAKDGNTRMTAVSAWDFVSNFNEERQRESRCLVINAAEAEIP